VASQDAAAPTNHGSHSKHNKAVNTRIINRSPDGAKFPVTECKKNVGPLLNVQTFQVRCCFACFAVVQALQTGLVLLGEL
jgi:hypothetical protein